MPLAVNDYYSGQTWATTLDASGHHIQNVAMIAGGQNARGGKSHSVLVQPTISTAIYAAGDVVTPLLTFTLNSVSGIIRQIVIHDDDNEKAAGKLWIFSAQPTAFAANDAFAPVLADLQALVGIVNVAAGDYTTVNSNAVAVEKDINLSYLGAGAALYMYFVCDATPTYTAGSDLSIRLFVMED